MNHNTHLAPDTFFALCAKDARAGRALRETAAAIMILTCGVAERRAEGQNGRGLLTEMLDHRFFVALSFVPTPGLAMRCPTGPSFTDLVPPCHSRELGRHHRSHMLPWESRNAPAESIRTKHSHSLCPGMRICVGATLPGSSQVCVGSKACRLATRRPSLCTSG